jgi:hypothetical protein
MARRHEDWNVGLAEDLRDPEFAREFLLGAIEEEVPLQVALGKVVRAMGVKEFAAKVPRWTAQIPPLIDTSNPAISDGRPRHREFYFVASSVRKSVWTFVRQLRGPHLSTWA